MDDRAVHRVREHYNRHANNGTSREALQRRRLGPALPLKRFHNLIKDKLIQRFCFGVDKVLDLCCGRGGDIRKWDIAKVQYVKGIDLSVEEIDEARRRLSEYASSNDPETVMEFGSSDVLGRAVYSDERAPYDVVTCFFALHYFMVSEKAIDNLFLNVTRNLKPGGYFICTCPDGKKVIAALASSPDRRQLQTPMLTLIPRWSGNYQCFGSAFTCSIADTVTEGQVEVDGSYEYLVFTTPLKHIGAKFGLKLITDYRDASLDGLFAKEDVKSGFKHFGPRFPRSDPSLEMASALNMAFVFQKVAEPKEDGGVLGLVDVEKLETSLPAVCDPSSPDPSKTRKRKKSPQRCKSSETSQTDTKKSKSCTDPRKYHSLGVRLRASQEMKAAKTDDPHSFVLPEKEESEPPKEIDASE